MNEEIKLRIKKLQTRAALFLIAIILSIVLTVLGLLCLFIPHWIAMLFFILSAICVSYLIYCNNSERKEIKIGDFKPVVFEASEKFDFADIIDIFKNMTDEGSRLSLSDDLYFFSLNNIFKIRIVLYRTVDFDKKDFDSSKDRINKKANRVFEISQWTSRTKAEKMMRLNIVYTETLNDALLNFISRNANRNLTRVEGIINIAIVGNQVIIPPIYGDVDFLGINRYKGIVKFINQALLTK